MKTKKFRIIIHWLMLISLVTVFISGILVKPFPGMWLGITHGVSSFVLMICVVMHCLQNNMFRFK